MGNLSCRLEFSLTAPETKSSSVTASFSGHETFVFRYAWMKKAVDGIAIDPKLFNREDAILRLGVGKNMVRSIRHWALATGVIEEKPKSRGIDLEPSRLGALLFGEHGYDPYLEDVNTLWLLHWKLTSDSRRATTWCWSFNLFPSLEFTRDGLAGFLSNETKTRGLKSPSESSLRRDVDCFVRTYTPSRSVKGVGLEDSLDCPLTELGLLVEDRDSSIVRFTRGERSTLSDAVFSACLLEFWEMTARGRETLSFADIAYSFGSPGRIFRLDEGSLMNRLERMELVTNGALVFGDTAGLKQVYKRSNLTVDPLMKYYAPGMAVAETGGVR